MVGEIFRPLVAACTFALLILVLDVGQVVDAANVAPVVFPPAQNWDGDDGPWSTFSLRLGNPEQIVRVLPSTSGYNTIAILPGACNTTSDPTGCANARGGTFDPSQSKTWQGQGLFGLGIENNLGYAGVNGNFGLDGVGFGVSINANLTFANQVIAGIVENDFYLGTFGLGTQPTNFTTFANPHNSFFTSLWNSNSTPSYTWSYTAGAKYQLTGVLGTLIFGGYDSSKFTPNNLTIPMSPDVSRDLIVGVQDITMTNSTGEIISLLPSGGIFSFVDSALPYIWLPLDACQAFENALGLVWNETAELYLVNDTLHSKLVASKTVFTFALGVATSGGQNIHISLPYAAFDKTATSPLVSNTTSYFPLKRATNDTQYTLGRAFLQEAYLIADYERMNFSLSQCVFQSGAQSNIVTIESVEAAKASASPTASLVASGGSPSISGGAIAGIVIGVLAVVAIIAGVLFWMRRKRKFLFKSGAAELEGSQTATQSDETAAKTNPLGDVASPELDGATVAPSEAMDTPINEMDGGGPPPEGYFAPKSRETAEMSDNTPAAQELSSPGTEIYEMFDSSVYREMPSEEGSQHTSPSRSPSSRTGNLGGLARRFSWVKTPLSAVVGPLLPAYEESNRQAGEGTSSTAHDTMDRKETITEEGPPSATRADTDIAAPKPTAPVTDPGALERELRAIVEEDTLGPMQAISPSASGPAASHPQTLSQPPQEERTISPPMASSPPAEEGVGTISPPSATSPPTASAEPISAASPSTQPFSAVSPPTATMPLAPAYDEDLEWHEDVSKDER